MIQPFRSDFNARFTPQKYALLLRLLNQRSGTDVQFRVAETPCFFAPEVLENLVKVGTDLTTQLLGNTEYRRASEAAIPAPYRVPNEGLHPHFMTVDFGFVRDSAGELAPKLVEMQAFPSIYGYQPMLAETYKEVYGLEPSLGHYLGGHDERSYWAILREIIVADHAAENVVLAEIEPEGQKTLPDFRMHEQHLGIRTVDVAKLIKQGRRLFYRNDSPNGDGRLIRIERLYNRAIVDELVRKGIQLPFDYRDDLDVEWAGHPNWYFRISKFSIPFLDHPSVPAAVFLDRWLDGEGRDRLPGDRENWILKPLYSFAGKGIQFSPSDADIEMIPANQRSQYLLQERVRFVPVIETPEGPTQAEVRILYCWPEGKAMVPMTSLVRMGRGLMMGVDHNRDRTWVGGSAALYSAHTSPEAAIRPPGSRAVD